MANLAKASLGAEDDETVATSISTVLSAVLKTFKAIVTRNELRVHQDQVPRGLWEDELGRLRVWAANIGAHQTGLSSLDYRLRDASHIKAQIVRLLEGLARKFRHLEEVLDEDPDELDKLDEEADLDHGGVTEIQQIYKALTENINLLFRMSMLIRRPAHHDRLLGTRREDAVIFEPFDRQHVIEKFPRANTEIANRLGAAISRRRAYLRYRDRHHAKLGKGITKIEDDKTVHASTELSETIATEFKEPNFNLDRMETESSYSQTSYAPTLLEGRSTMTVPSPPKGSANGQPFECPYCFFITTVKDSRSWARHVFKDIMPYVCIFTDCSIPHQLYDSRRDWYRHLVNDHHGWVKDDAQAECPLCQEINLPASKLERHLGRHLEELALFALPRTDANEDLDSNESSHHSSRASETPAEGHPNTRPSNENLCVPAIERTSSAPNTEVFKTFKVGLEDPCYKVLPAAMRKYNIQGDWQQYGLYIVYGDQERVVGMEEKPLALFKDLEREGKKPMFMLRKLAGSVVDGVAAEIGSKPPDSGETPAESHPNTQPSNENLRVLTIESTSSGPSVEIFKSFRVGLEDPCYKVLPAALRKYNIQGDWRQYELYIVYGDQERVVGMEEKPLALFKDLEREGKKPMFMLRKLAGSAVDGAAAEIGSKPLDSEGRLGGDGASMSSASSVRAVGVQSGSLPDEVL